MSRHILFPSLCALTCLAALTGCPATDNNDDEASATLVDTLEDVVDASDDKNSLREALAAAQESGDPVTFAADLEGTIALGSPLTISGSGAVEIDGPGKDVITVDGQKMHQLIVLSGPSLTIKGLSLNNGKADANGGGIFIENGSVDITDSTLQGNEADRGAAIYMRQEGGEITISGVSFLENKSSGLGGALFINGEGELPLISTITDSVFKDNTAAGNGGAINMGDINVTMTLTGCTFENNSVSGNANTGGAIKATGNLVVKDSVFKGNSITGDESNGGAISHSGLTNENTLMISGSTFDANTASGEGGALHASFSKIVDIENTSFTNNSAERDGGAAIMGASEAITITDSTFTGNSTPRWGGALYLSSDTTIGGTTISMNTAEFGGGIYMGAGISVTLGAETLVSGNTATSDSSNGVGGGVCNSSSELVLSGGSVTGNSSDDVCDPDGVK